MNNIEDTQHSHKLRVPIKWYEGYYVVDEQGIVRSIDRYVDNRGGKQFCKWQTINPFYNDRWYPIVNLELQGKNRKRLVSRLVAQAFLWLNIDDSNMFVCHKDDNPRNNSVDNLFLWTHKDNAMDMTRKGRSPKNWNYISKYTEEQMKGIVNDPTRLSEKCIKYSIHRNTISNYKRKLLTSKQ